MRLSYSTFGERSNPSILFLHGFMGSGADWDEICDKLQSDCFCILPDLPGHGKSVGGSDRDYSIEETSRALMAILDELSIETVIVVGYSMGGRIGLYTAIEHPKRIRAVVLESSSPGLQSQTERDARMELDRKRADMIVKLGMDAFIDEWYDATLFESLHSSETRLSKLKANRRNNIPDELAKSLIHAGTGAQPSLWERLGEMDISALLLCGELDDKFTVINREMSHLIKSAKLTIVPGVGHNVHFEQPAVYSRLLSEFAESMINR